MRRILTILLLLLPVLASARDEPPQIEVPETTPRNFTIFGANLRIIPGEQNSYLRFSGGVRCVTEDFVLESDVLELDIGTVDVTGGQPFNMPKTPMPEERVTEDPGAAVREMAAEMSVPSAKFSANAIKRVGAVGGVHVAVQGLSLTTDELVSTDGGQSWSANGRSTLNHCSDDDNCYEIAADYILYDTVTQRALARGGIKGSYSQPGKKSVAIEAERVELDVENSLITVSEYLLVSYEGFSLCCGSLAADIDKETLEASDSPHLESVVDGISADAGSISVDFANMIVTATGGVVVRDSVRNLVLESASIIADLNNNRLEARGNPVLRQNDSTFTGSLIKVFEENDKTVIEVEGPQSAHLDLEELELNDDTPQAEPGQDPAGSST